MASTITNPDAQFNALFAGRTAPEPRLPERPLRWSCQAQVDAQIAILDPAEVERFELFATLSDGSVVSTGFGYRFGGKAVAKRVAA